MKGGIQSRLVVFMSYYNKYFCACNYNFMMCELNKNKTTIDAGESHFITDKIKQRQTKE